MERGRMGRKTQTKIKWLVDPDYGSLESIHRMAETTPRLKKLIGAIFKTEVPVEIVLGQIDITNLPEPGENLKYTKPDGQEDYFENVAVVISSAGQEGRELYESKSHEYWIGSRAIFSEWDKGEEKLKVIRGMRGPDGVEWGYSTTLAICQYAQNSSTVPEENRILAKQMVLGIQAQWEKIKGVMGSEENPLGGIANIMAVRATDREKIIKD